MKQEDKELLLKDISARLPYGVKIQVYYEEMAGSGYFDETVWTVDNDEPFHVNDRWIENIKPYLFPISSMTEEQKEEYYSLADDVTIKPGQGSYFGIKIHCIKLGISDNPHEGVWDWIDLDAIDWLNKNHFDYRGLIERGLALDATGLDVY